MRPEVSIVPEVGCRIEVISWSRVDFPEPLRPITPSV